MMTTITFRVDEQTKRALEIAAQHDDRKPTTLARLIIRDSLKQRGYLLTEHGDDRQRNGQGVQA
jgi:predicted transcriptional regulator